MSRNILIVAGHPDLASSNANAAILEYLESLPVTIHKLEEHHDNYIFSIAKEQELLVNHDRIVLLFPLYWYAVPALMKKWLEDVIAPGFAIGRGDSLKGKEIMAVTTVGAPQEGYCAGGFNRFTIDELLRPLEQMVFRTKARYITPVKVYRSVFLSPEEMISSVHETAKKIVKDYEEPLVQYERMIQLVPDLWQKKERSALPSKNT